MIGIPLALGSYWGLLFVIPGLAVLAIRILDEEKVLTHGAHRLPRLRAAGALPAGALRLVKEESHEDRSANAGVADFSELVFFGVLLFWPAGTLNYWQAWVFIAVFIVATPRPEHLSRGEGSGGPAAAHACRAERRNQNRSEDSPSRARSPAWSRCWSSAPSTIGSVGRRCRHRSSWLAISWSPSGWASRAGRHPEQLRGRHHHGRGGPDGGLHGPVWPCPASDVRRRADHDDRHAPCARLLLGTAGYRPVPVCGPDR